MEKNITYLFGAGASCETLPILKNMPATMENQVDFLNNKAGYLLSIINDEKDKYILEGEIEYIEDLKWLMNKSKQHASVDTLARKLFLNGKNSELNNLKNCLSVFLLIEQLRNHIDLRYDTFFASVLESKFQMPKNLKVVSWNYDLLFEMAYQSFVNEPSLANAQTTLGVFMKFNDNWRANKDFGIFKLNGSSIAYHSDRSQRQIVYSNINDRKLTIELLEDIFKSYNIIKSNFSKYISGLSFAWEQDNINSEGKDIISMTKENTSETEILVIVGYSIPFFNRRIDREIIKNMTKLKKVYFQAPDADALIERFNSIRDDLDGNVLVPILNCDQFYIPNEM